MPSLRSGDGAGAAEVFDADGLDGLLVGGGIELGEGLGAEVFEGFFHGRRDRGMSWAANATDSRV